MGIQLSGNLGNKSGTITLISVLENISLAAFFSFSRMNPRSGLNIGL